jgi:hypothetical protein
MYDVWVLMEVKETLIEHMGKQLFGGIQRASERRLLSFDKSNHYRVV